MNNLNKSVGWRTGLLLLLWVVAAFAFAPPPPPVRPKAVTAHQNDTLVCATIDDRLYGINSDDGKQLADTITAEFKAVAETPIPPATMARAQFALLNYCQNHPTVTLRAAVEATWQTL
jgi:hypothetical protein